MKTILITGGSGKVGFQLVNHFLEGGFIVITTTRNKANFLKNAKDKLSSKHVSNLKIIEVNFTANDALDIIFTFLRKEQLNPSSIIHNARSLEFMNIEENGTVKDENFLGEFFLDVV